MVFAQALENSNGTGKVLAFVVHTLYSPNEELDSKTNDLSSDIDALSLNASSTDMALESITDAIGLNLADASAGLDINSDVAIRGALKVDHIGAIGDLLALESDVDFIGRPYFNSDTGGVAIIDKGSRQVDVKFERAYSDSPVISASVTLNASSTPVESGNILADGVDFVVTDRSGEGFSILLARPATEQMQFSWIALAIKNLRISTSADTVQPDSMNTGTTDTTTTDGTNISDTSTTPTSTQTSNASSTPTSTSTSTPATIDDSTTSTSSSTPIIIDSSSASNASSTPTTDSTTSTSSGQVSSPQATDTTASSTPTTTDTASSDTDSTSQTVDSAPLTMDSTSLTTSSSTSPIN
jgi:hypothetical protein